MPSNASAVVVEAMEASSVVSYSNHARTLVSSMEDVTRATAEAQRAAQNVVEAKRSVSAAETQVTVVEVLRKSVDQLVAARSIVDDWEVIVEKEGLSQTVKRLVDAKSSLLGLPQRGQRPLAVTRGAIHGLEEIAGRLEEAAGKVCNRAFSFLEKPDFVEVQVQKMGSSSMSQWADATAALALLKKEALVSDAVEKLVALLGQHVIKRILSAPHSVTVKNMVLVATRKGPASTSCSTSDSGWLCDALHSTVSWLRESVTLDGSDADRVWRSVLEAIIATVEQMFSSEYLLPRVPADVCDHGGFLNVAEELAQAVGSVLSAGNNEGTSRMVERARCVVQSWVLNFTTSALATVREAVLSKYGNGGAAPLRENTVCCALLECEALDFPNVPVSNAGIFCVRKVLALLDHAIAAGKDLEMSVKLFGAVRYACQLFAVLNKGIAAGVVKLDQSALESVEEGSELMLRHNDCMAMAHLCVALSASMRRHVPEAPGNCCSLFKEVLSLRGAAQACYKRCIADQHLRTGDMVPASGLARMRDTGSAAAVNAAWETIRARLQALHKLWYDILPPSLADAAVCDILEWTASLVVSAVVQLDEIVEEDISALETLLADASEIHTLAPATKTGKMPGLERLNLLRDIIGMSLEDIASMLDSDALSPFTNGEVERLVTAMFDESSALSDILYVLRSKK